MEYLELLKMHKNCTSKEIELLKQKSGREIECSLNGEIKEIRKKTAQVANEMHRMLAFIRLEQNKNILHGYAKFEHEIGLEVVKKLARRTPNTLVIIGDENRSYKGLYIKQEPLLPNSRAEKYYAQKLASYDKTLKNFRIEVSEDKMKELWKEYYWSQYAKNRKNTRLFSKHVPKREMNKVECELTTEIKAPNLQNWI